jgi:hypothetical protein
MHVGDKDETADPREATPEEARALVEDGVPILPVPIRSRARATDAA